MTRLPVLVGALVLVASVGGGALGLPGSGAAGPGAVAPDLATDAVADDAIDRTTDDRTANDSVTADCTAAECTADDCTANDGTTDDQRAAVGRALVVADAETGDRLLEVPVAEGTAVALNYTHSVEKTPVLDVYEVDGTQLEMVRMEFHSFGAGLPSRADVNVTEDGTFVFDPEGRYDHVYVKPGEIAGHELLVDDRCYDLVALSAARSVKLSVTNRSSATTTERI